MKKEISFDMSKAMAFVSPESVKAYAGVAKSSIDKLYNATGEGNDFLGWLTLPNDTTPQLLAEINSTASLLRNECDVVVVIGIGGSYLGAKAVIDAMNNTFDWLDTKRKNPVIVYAGENIGEDYLYELSAMLKNRRFGIISISKSGTTTERNSIPLAQNPVGKPSRQRNSQKNHSLHHRPQSRCATHTGKPGGLQNFCYRRQRRRTLFSAHPRRPAADSGRRFQYRAAHCRSTRYERPLRSRCAICQQHCNAVCRRS